MSKASDYEKKWKRKNGKTSAAPDDFWFDVQQARDDLNIPQLTEKPPGTFTINDYARRFGVSRQIAEVHVKKMLHNGRAVTVGALRRNERCFRMKNSAS